MTISPPPPAMNHHHTNNHRPPPPAAADSHRCELCQGQAAVYCSSDEARLCFQCDTKVHGANFLVSRHSRSLLCRRCSSPTAWSASGPTLPALTFSLCDRCYRRRNCSQEPDSRVLAAGATAEETGENGDDIDEEDEEYEDTEDDEYDNNDDGENQVVPWSPPQPSIPIDSTSYEEGESEYYRSNTKRSRDECKFQDDMGFLSSFESETSMAAGASSSDEYREFRPLKRGVKNEF